jgi:hypothetical protein
MSEYMDTLQRLERDRQRMIAEMMAKPFGDRCMSDARESELADIEEFLLCHPPEIGTHDHQPIYAGRGLIMEDEAVKDDGPSAIQVIPQSEWPSYIEGQGGEQQLHCEPYVKFTLNQGSVGSCAPESGVGVLMVKRFMSGQKHVELNPYFVYHTTSGGSDRGSTLSGTVQFLADNGCASAAVWSRSNGWRTRPSAAAYADAKRYRHHGYERVQNWEQFGTLLLNSEPVYFGYSGHAIFATRLISPTRFRYKNSWGNWGENGYGTLASSSIMWGYGAYIYTGALWVPQLED